MAEFRSSVGYSRHHPWWAIHPRAAAPLGALLVAYVLMPALLGWFLYTAMDSASRLVQDEARLPTEASYDPYFDDFVVFYAAGAMTLDGDGNIYEVSAIQVREEETVEQSPGSTLPLPFFNPPPVALVLAPLTLLPLMPAAAAWTVAGLISFWASAFALIRGRLARAEPIVIGIWVAGIASALPFYQTLIHGQTSFFLFTGWSLFWLGSFRSTDRRLTVPGLLLLSLKPQLLVLPLVYLAFQKRWGLLAEVSAWLAGATSLAILLLGPGLISDYVQLLANATTWDGQNGISIWGMFGWNAFSNALLPNAEGPRLALTLGLDAMTVGLVCVGIRRLRRRGAAEHLFATLLFGSLLISPHFYAHDVLLALAPILLMATSASASTRWTWTLYAAVGWLLLFFHFDVLASTNVNASTLWLSTGAVISAFPELPTALGGWARRRVSLVTISPPLTEVNR